MRNIRKEKLFFTHSDMFTFDRLIKEHGQWEVFNKRVEEEILFDIDDKMRKQRYGRLTKITNEIVGQFANKYSLSTSLGDIVDEEDIAALKRLDTAMLNECLHSFKKFCYGPLSIQSEKFRK